MGHPEGFIDIKRKEGGYRPKHERIADFGEVEQTLDEDDRRDQASRCMDCGVPFCHWSCPLGSKIPEWQDALYRGQYKEAYEILSNTNVMPEITGRVCPAPCEKSCTLAIHDEALTIRENECASVEKAFDLGYVIPVIPSRRTGKKIAVIGSGPAGISAANQLNQYGHIVTVFEQDKQIGGLLRYGIPDFKLNKHIIDRRIDLLQQEGIVFQTSVCVGKDLTVQDLLNDYDAIVLAIGAMYPRDIAIEGRNLEGVHFAMDFLKQQNQIVNGKSFTKKDRISAQGKHVLVIGGGDTGSDCVGTSIRQKAKSVTQIEILPQPPLQRNENNPWPYWPNVLRTSSSHLEGCDRKWSLSTKKFIDINGKLGAVELIQLNWYKDESGQMHWEEVKGTNQIIKVDLVLICIGFLHPVYKGLLEKLEVGLDEKGNVEENNNQTNIDKIFVAGDACKGASLVVHAIESGKQAANSVHEYLLSSI